jgi:hypothetical protein
MSDRPTLEYLKTRLSVDIEGGRVFWINATKHHARLNGKEAGCKRLSKGKYYWHIKINGYPIKRAHIVFLFATGKWAEPLIDHINGDSLCDEITNIREATHSQNCQNIKSIKKSSPLPMGVRVAVSGRFVARIRHNNKPQTIGTFDTPADASIAYQKKRIELFGDFA